jgi:hypothetical protein
MANSISSVTTGTGGIVLESVDTSGNTNIKSGTTTIVAVTSTGAAVTGTLAFTAISGGIGKVGAITRGTGTASGNVSYTGVGFTPSLIIMMGGVGTVPQKCWGFSTLANGQSLYSDVSNANTTTANLFHFVRQTDTQDAVIASMDADGFTLTWTRTGAGATGNAISISYIAFR